MSAGAMTDSRRYAAEAVLRDGGSIHVRAIRPDDKGRLVDHFRRLSPKSIHLRFFGAKRALSEAELVRFTELDFVRDAALVATLGEGADERIIGVGRYSTTAPGRAEVAFAVADEYQGRGIGALLLDHLAPLARENGVTELEADVLGENNRMLAVFRKSGYVAKRSIESGVVHLTFPTEETDLSARVRIEREVQSSAESVRHFLRPASIAVVLDDGADGARGRRVLANLRRSAFAGSVRVVHANAEAIEGFACATRLAEIEPAPELVVVALAAAQVEAAVRDCGAARARALLVLSRSAEPSDDARRWREEIARQVRHAGMRLIGPGSFGIIDTDPEHALDASCAEAPPSPGNVGLLVQGGALARALLEVARLRGVGLSSFVSVGDKADVSGNDVLSYWMSEARTAAVGLYLESFGNPRRFARIAPRLAREKPIVAVKPRRSSLADTETAREALTEALFRQAGVIRTDTIDELFGVLSLLSSETVACGTRVAIATNVAGAGALAADTCTANSLHLALLDPGTTDALRRGGVRDGARNPVDLGEGAGGALYEVAIDALGADACVDAVLCVYVPPLGSSRADVAAGIARGAARVERGKPVLAAFVDPSGAPAELHEGSRGRLPCYPFPEDAAMALGAAARYGRWRARPSGTALELDRMSLSTVRAVVDRVRSQGDGHGWLEARDFATVLRAAGIAYAESYFVEADEAADFAETIGYPLVAKAVAPGLARRADAGCIVMGLSGRAAVEDAVRLLRQRTAALHLGLESILLQREVAAGIEAIAEVRVDPHFGPFVLCGLGGVLVSLLGDEAVRLPPVTDVDAAEMIDGLRAKALLDGYRGVGPGDRKALEDLLLRLSALVDAIPELRGLELSPIKVLPPGYGVVVVDGRLEI